MKYLFGLLVCFYFNSTYAVDLGFRFRDGKCVNSNDVEGLNLSHFGPCGDFRNASLGRLDLSGLDLSGSRFDGADLQVINFSNSKLEGVSFQLASMAGVSFSQANVSHTSFLKANISNMKIDETIFDMVDFSDSQISRSELDYFTCNHCQFRNATLSEINLNDAVMADSDLSEVKTRNVSLNRANFTNSNFEKAQLILSVFRDAQFTSSNLQGANLKNSDFIGSKFANSNMKDSFFSKGTKLSMSMDEARSRGMIFVKANSTIFAWAAFGDLNDSINGEVKNVLLEVQKADQAFKILNSDNTVVSEFKAKLAGADVFVLPEMEKGTNVQFVEEVGASVLSFVESGGVVVALASYEKFLEQSGLLPKANCENDTISDNSKLPILDIKNPLMAGFSSDSVATADELTAY